MVRLVKWELPLPYVSEEGNESWFTIAHNNHRVSTKDVRKVQLYKNLVVYQGRILPNRSSYCVAVPCEVPFVRFNAYDIIM